MRFTLHVWRQKDRGDRGRFVTYEVEGITPDHSFLELLDVLNERLTEKREDPIAFDHDCREGICGSCGLMINGVAHGPLRGTATCQLHMRHFGEVREIRVEPWRARAFPVIKDLVVERRAFDRIIESGGYISINTGAAVEANTYLVPKPDAERSMDAAACISCGACVAQCPNGAAHLFTAAKVSHLGQLPQGQPERYRRVVRMVEAQEQFFGSCTMYGECEAVCPKEISIDFIASMNGDYLRARLGGKKVRAVET